MDNAQNIDFRAAFFDIAHTPFVILDKDMVFLDINETALSFLDMEREDILGRRMKDALPSISGTERYQAYLDVIETGKPIRIDDVRLMVGSQEFFFSIKAFKVGDGLGMAGLNTTKLVNIIKDLEYTQHELEIANMDLKERNRELEEFSYLTSHDLKAPLTNVQMLLSMLGEDGVITNTGKVIYEKLVKAVGLMSAKLVAINKMIAIKGSVGNPKKIIAFEDMVSDIKNELSEDIRRTGTKIKTDFLDCPKIYMDPIQLHSILQNLITNAIKYKHPERNPEVTISTKTHLKKTFIQVKDNGLGFDKKMDEDKIFGLFKRLHTHVEGLGIGLYIVKSIAESHGGHVEVETEHNLGTIFKIVI